MLNRKESNFNEIHVMNLIVFAFLFILESYLFSSFFYLLIIYCYLNLVNNLKKTLYSVSFSLTVFIFFPPLWRIPESILNILFNYLNLSCVPFSPLCKPLYYMCAKIPNVFLFSFWKLFFVGKMLHRLKNLHHWLVS